MLDAIQNLPTDTEDAAVERAAIDAFGAGLATGPWTAGSPFNLESQRVMAASMMMAPFAMAQAASVAMRRARSLAKTWGERAAACRSMDELIEVNKAYGERALSLGAGEMWRVLEKSAYLGRAAAAPKTLELRDAKRR